MPDRMISSQAAATLVLVLTTACGNARAWAPEPTDQLPSGSALHMTVDTASRELVLQLSPVVLSPTAQEAAHGAGAGHDHGAEVRYVARQDHAEYDDVAHHASHGMERTPFEFAEIPVDAWLIGFEAEVLDASGRRLPQAMLHHVNLMAPGSRDLFRPIMQRIAAAGEETERITLPWPFGVPVHAGQRVAAFAMVHDPDGITNGPVTVRMRLRYARGPGRIAVQPFFIDASPPPGPAGWDLPPGHSTRSWEGSPAVAGRIMAVGGHLHRYGRELILEDVDAGRVLVRLAPVYAADGSLEAVERRNFIGRLGIPIEPGRRYRITAVYDNPTGDTIRDGAMGAIGGMMRPRVRPWPAANLSDELYRRDLDMLFTEAAPAGAPAPHHHH